MPVGDLDWMKMSQDFVAEDTDNDLSWAASNAVCSIRERRRDRRGTRLSKVLEAVQQPAKLCETQGKPAKKTLLQSDTKAFDRDFELGDELGTGAFGSVRMATRIRDGTLVAVKAVGVDDPSRAKDLRTEIAIMRSVEHPHLMQLQAVFWAPNKLKVRARALHLRFCPPAPSAHCWQPTG